MQSAASAKDMQYVAHMVLASCSAAELALACPGFHADMPGSVALNQAGRQARDRWKRATAGMTEALPDPPQGELLAAGGPAVVAGMQFDTASSWGFPTRHLPAVCCRNCSALHGRVRAVC